jgi:hypothetical protein
MVEVAQVAVCSQINTKHINRVWAERTVVWCDSVLPIEHNLLSQHVKSGHIAGIKFVPIRLINLLNTKRRPLYLNTQSVPPCKHFSSRL